MQNVTFSVFALKLEIVETNSYLQNLLAINKFQRRQRIRLFFLESEPNWSQHLPLIGWSDLWEIRPYYDWFTNSLVIPAGGLSDPSFEATRPQVFNYAMLGSEIATTMVYSISEIGYDVLEVLSCLSFHQTLLDMVVKCLTLSNSRLTAVHDTTHYTQ